MLASEQRSAVVTAGMPLDVSGVDLGCSAFFGTLQFLALKATRERHAS